MDIFKKLSKDIVEYKKRVLKIYDKKITIPQFFEYTKIHKEPFYSIWKYEFLKSGSENWPVFILLVPSFVTG